ncbi:hypothetical protein BDR03DRAFT_1016946 [Suillus americanus]|nr:hypothetical protein BDR03DRAFT_1016946 [Suillus americanus]
MPKLSNLDTSAAVSVSASDRSKVPLVSKFPSLQLTDTYAATSHNLDASFKFVLPDSISSESVARTIDPSLLSNSELPVKPHLYSLPPSTSAQQLKPIPAHTIVYVRRPPGVSASQEASAFSDKVPGKSQRNVQIRYRTGRVGRVFTDDASAFTPIRLTQSTERRGQDRPSNRNEWKICTVRDLEPSVIIPPLVSGEKCLEKGKGKAIERLCVYIGNAKWLHMPYAHMPTSLYPLQASSLDLDE